MKVCLIPPNCMLHKKMDMDFVLAHRAMYSKRYKDHYAMQNTWKILDNGIYEGEMMDVEDILEISGEIMADEVILPDWIMKRQKKRYYQDLIPSLPKHLRYMIIPQGKDPQEWRESYLELITLEDIYSVGIPIWLTKEFNSRPIVVNYMFKKGELDLSKNHHLLGLDSYWELINYQSGVIRSVDTSMPFSMAQAKEQSFMYSEPPEHRRIDPECRIDDMDLEILDYEVGMLRGISRLV